MTRRFCREEHPEHQHTFQNRITSAALGPGLHFMGGSNLSVGRREVLHVLD